VSALTSSGDNSAGGVTIAGVGAAPASSARRRAERPAVVAGAGLDDNRHPPLRRLDREPACPLKQDQFNCFRIEKESVAGSQAGDASRLSLASQPRDLYLEPTSHRPKGKHSG
jgi:hypothetical protein